MESPKEKVKTLSYSQVGVDVNIEAKAARILYSASKETWINRKGLLGEVIVPFDDFSGIRFVKVDNLPSGTVVFGGSDGVATKTELAEKAGKFDTIAFDLIAMVCDDAVIRGGEPVLLKSVLAVNTLGSNESRLKYIQEMADGYVKAAQSAGVVIINGEIAQHNDRLGKKEDFVVDWSGDVTWFANESRLITGLKVKEGDFLIGLRETGLRCNGISLARKALKTIYGDNWHYKEFNGQRLVDIALQPSQIYSKAVVEMFGGWDLKKKSKAILNGAAHISGGGIPEKLGRALKPSGYGAIIDEPFDPCDLMIHCQEAGISDREAYNTWNMGQGMILISPDPDSIISIANKYAIDAKVIGKVTSKKGIVINGRGRNKETVEF